MELDLNLGLGGEHNYKSTPKLQLTATPPRLTTLQSGVASTINIPIVFTKAGTITAVTFNSPDATLTSPTIPLKVTAGQSVDFKVTLNSTTAGQHYVYMTLTDGTLSKKVIIHYVVAGANQNFIINNGKQIVNNHKIIIND